jgi:hypothetical protein
MSIFTMILDIACSNAYAITCTLSMDYKRSVSFWEFGKWHVLDPLMLLWNNVRPKGKGWKCKKPLASQQSMQTVYIFTSSQTMKRGRMGSIIRMVSATFARSWEQIKWGVTRSLPRWGASSVVSATTCDAST